MPNKRKMAKSGNDGPGSKNKNTLQKPLTIYFELRWKDPDDPASKTRVFPPGFLVKIVFEDGAESRGNITDDGKLTVTIGGAATARARKSFSLSFGDNSKNHIICEKPGDDAVVTLGDQPERDEHGTIAKRLFKLPSKWSMLESDWTVTDHDARYDADKARFDLMKASFPADLGTPEARVKLLLDPHWQYVRFEYFDRFFGHSAEQAHKPVCVPPVVLEGFRERHAKSPPPPDTRSTWVLDPAGDGKAHVQCLPWIIQKKPDGAADPMPEKGSVLRFTQKADTWVVAESATKRETLVMTGELKKKHPAMAKPCADRLKYYDLPTVWKSCRYYGWLSDSDGEKGWYEKIAAKPTTKAKPLVFSLDDIVLTEEKAGKFKLIELKDKHLPTLFFHTFQKPTAGNGGRDGGTFDDEGVYSPGSTEDHLKKAAKALGEAIKTVEVQRAERKAAEDKKALEFTGPAETKARKAESDRNKKRERDAAEREARTLKKSPSEVKAAGDLAENGSDAKHAVGIENVVKDASAKARRDNRKAIAEAGDKAADEAPTKHAGDITNAGTTAEGAAIENAVLPFSNIKLLKDSTSYIVDYPHWTRIVAAGGNLFDVFDKRVAQEVADHEDEYECHAVGARAAVRWVESATSAREPGVEVAAIAVTEHPDKYFATEPFFRQTHTNRFSLATDTLIGRFDMSLVRCCDVDPADAAREIAVNLYYFRVCVDFALQEPGDGKTRTEYRQLLTSNINAHWNGRGGFSTKTEFRPVDGDPKLTVRLSHVMQHQPRATSHLLYKIQPGAGRACVNSGKGEGELGKVSYKREGVSSPGWFTASHEGGHFGSLNDDYGEKWSYCSYDLLDFSNITAGLPYDLDRSALMAATCQTLRGRNFWVAAEWMRSVTKHAFKVKHDATDWGGGGDDDFQLPPHPSAPRQTYASLPAKQALQQTTAVGSKFDLFLWKLGEDRTSKKELPDFAGSPGKFTGILVVVVKLKWTLSFNDHNWIKRFTAHAEKVIQDNYNKKFRATGTLTLDGKDYTFDGTDRCLLHFSPRFLVTNYSGPQAAPSDNPTYNTYASNLPAWTGGGHFDLKVIQKDPPVLPIVADPGVNAPGIKWAGATLNIAVSFAGGQPTWETQIADAIKKPFRKMVGIDVAKDDVAAQAGDLKALVEKVLPGGDAATL